MPLPALEDIADPIDGVVRIETSPREKATPIIMEMMRSVYPHDEVFGEYCTVNDYIDCPPDELYAYLSDTRSLEEWTYSLRGFTPTEERGLWLAYDRLGSETEIYTRTVANPDARTVDYHCAWDQGKHLWMIYLMRVVDAQVVLDKPGSVVLWTNCHHPFYDRNPYPEAATPGAAGMGWRLLGHVRCRPPPGVEEPQGNCRIPPPPWSAGDTGLDEMRAAMNVSLVDVSTYLPGDPIGADYYAQFAESDDLRDNMMFRAPKFRHHVAEDETAIDMVERAAEGLIERHGDDAIANVDVLITHTQMPDMPFYGGGGGMAHRLGMKPRWVLDLHNGGCAAFVLGLKLARNLLASGEGRTALIAVAQNAAGQIFDQPTVRRKAQASVPGDGAAVGLLSVSDESPILDVECRTYGQYAGEMTIAVDPERKWWQAGSGEGSIGFSESKITKVLARGNRQVPEVAYAVCDRVGLKTGDIDLLVTNQPNRVFLRNWREALELPKERHVDTFDECGNLFAAGIPVNLDRAISDGRLKKGDLVMMAAFAHAGDFAGAAAIRWGGRP